MVSIAKFSLAAEQCSLLAIGGLTLEERLDPAMQHLWVEDQTRTADTLIQEIWAHQFAGLDRAAFENRLSRAGLSSENLAAKLHPIRWRDNSTFPPWISEAEALIDQILHAQEAEDCRRLPATRQPFEHLFVPIGMKLSAQIKNIAQNASVVLGARAQESVVSGSISSIAQLAVATLHSDMLQWLGAANQQSLNCDYPAYINQLINGKRIVQILTQRPMLLRQMCNEVTRWRIMCNELVSRFASDFCDLQVLIKDDALEEPHLFDIQWDRSDRHNHGRTTSMVWLSPTSKVWYKPKSLAIDYAWGKIISWFNDRCGEELHLRSPRVVVRDNYGWAEHIDHGVCTNESELDLFFSRAGSLVALAYLLCGRDFHRENIIACGANPILIDMEMLCQPVLSESATLTPMSALRKAQGLLDESVLTTDLLPSWIKMSGGKVVSLSGFFSSNNVAEVVLAWSDVNTVEMAPYCRIDIDPDARNSPFPESSQINIQHYGQKIMEGFVSAATLIKDRKSELLDFIAQSTVLFDIPIRIAIRPTRLYAAINGRMLNELGAESGITWSLQADVLWRFVSIKENDWTTAFVAHERVAACRRDIPYFFVRSDGLQVLDGEGVLVTSVAQSGLSAVFARIGSLDAQSIKTQERFIWSALLSPANNAFINRIPAPQLLPVTASSDSSSTKVVDPIESAASIAEIIYERAIADGISAAWIGLDSIGEGGRWRLAPLGFDLYGGTSGIAVFLAAASLVLRDRRYRELALKSFAPFVYLCDSEHGRRFIANFGIGGATGMGSVAYAMATVGDLLEEDSLVLDAVRTALKIDDALLDADDEQDVIGGAAGCVLALLKVHRVSGDLRILELAVRCGERLLNSRLTYRGELLLWQGRGAVPLAGFSHGMSGFALAMASLFETTGSSKYLAAVEDCISYESSLYEAHRDWPDLRSDPPTFPCQWCHGAGGVALARLGILKKNRIGLINKRVNVDMENAIQRVHDRWPSVLDTACCGAVGNVSVIHSVGIFRRDQTLVSEAQRRLQQILVERNNSGSYKWNAGNDHDNLGFFQGISGIGYYALRIHSAEILPNILLWE